LNIVVDSSLVVAALVSRGDDGRWAEEIIEKGSLYAPELIRVEVVNVLRHRERAKEITEQEAGAAFEDFMQLELDLYPFEPFAERIWELRHNVVSYDAWHVALAEALNASLATLDGRLVAANGPTCPFLTPATRSPAVTLRVHDRGESAV
jgi:predicted nucleic acid-binding protein